MDTPQALTRMSPKDNLNSGPVALFVGGPWDGLRMAVHADRVGNYHVEYLLASDKTFIVVMRHESMPIDGLLEHIVNAYKEKGS